MFLKALNLLSDIFLFFLIYSNVPNSSHILLSTADLALSRRYWQYSWYQKLEVHERRIPRSMDPRAPEARLMPVGGMSEATPDQRTHAAPWTFALPPKIALNPLFNVYEHPSVLIRNAHLLHNFCLQFSLGSCLGLTMSYSIYCLLCSSYLLWNHYKLHLPAHPQITPGSLLAVFVTIFPCSTETNQWSQSLRGSAASFP